MAKKKISIILIILMIFNIYSLSFGENDEKQYIKIGLKNPIKSDYQVEMTFENGFIVGLWDDEFENIVNFENDFLAVRLDTYYNIEKNKYIKTDDIDNADVGPYHIELKNNYNTYDEVMAKINELEIVAYPVYDDGFKIWIGQFIDDNSAQVKLESMKDIIGNAKVIKNNENMLLLQNEKNEINLVVNTTNDIYIKSMKTERLIDIIGVEEYNYRDYITFNIYENQLIVINYIEINHYLYGVVPREMSANWHIEALKAQAIAARNYTIVNKNKHKNLGYDLCDTQDCQAYGGYNWEREKTNKAVDETQYELIKYQGRPINAYYHSSSGGHTEDSENIWKNEVPYLRGVEDQFSLGSPNDNWQFTLETDVLERELEENSIKVGEIISIEPVLMSDSGRVLKLIVKGTDGVKTLEKESVRKIFGYSNIKSIWYKVNSDADVYVISANDSEPQKTILNECTVISEEGMQMTSRSYRDRYQIFNGLQKNTVSVIPTSYVFDGKGWGHGLGMSQWGAKKMAEEGYNYKDILEYYYTRTKVE